MGKLYLMTTIVDRKKEKRYFEFYKENDQNVMFSTLGMGTASSDILDYLGLESTEKVIIFSVQEEERWSYLKKQLKMRKPQ